ncbi:MAG: helix-turn-helix domain-containing protein [Anaerolineae bacterium]|nr:helix-turn-helix domain-containing protein [Anaerolineae bacterium]
MDFSEWLAEEMKNRSYSQGRLAESVGVSQPYISRLLKGDKKPGIELCLKLAEVFDVSVDYVLRVADILPPPIFPGNNETTQRIVDIVRQLSPERQQEVLDFVRFKFKQQQSESD